MKTFKKGDIVTNDRYAAMGKSFTYVEYHKTARGGDSHEVRNSGGMPDFFGDDAGLYVVNPAPAPFKVGDVVDGIYDVPGHGAVIAEVFDTGHVITTWPNRSRHVEEKRFLKHAKPTAKAGDKTGSFDGPHIHFEVHDGQAVKAGDRIGVAGHSGAFAHRRPHISAFTTTLPSVNVDALAAAYGRAAAKGEVSTKTRAKTLHEAGKLIDGDRANDYDTKDDARGNFNRIAQLWEPILGTDITATQVALCLTQLKVARIIVNPTKADSWIDAAGYIALGSEIAEQEASNPTP